MTSKRRARRLSRCVLAAVLGGALSTAVLAMPAIAVAQVPHPPGAIDGRGWELVSPADKNRNSVIEAGAVAATDGNRVLFGLFGGVPIAPTGARPKLLATRTATGWRSKSPMPPRTQMLAESYAVVSYAPDLSGWIASAQDSLGATDISPDVSLARLDENGHQTPLHTFPVYFGASGAEVVASDDLEHVFTDAPEPIDPSHVPGTGNVYDVGSGTPVLVSRMPGTGLAPTCGVLQGVEFANNIPGATSQNWVSRNGSRAFFMTRGDDAPACDDPPQLYVRDTKGTPTQADDVTTPISGPVLPGAVDAGVEQFLQATPDGSQVFYRTATSLTATDDADGNAADFDIYRWTAQSGNVCMTCIGGSANVLTGFSGAAISPDGSHVYFASAAQLAPGAPATTEDVPNIYVAHAGVLRYIGTTDANGVSDQPRFGGALMPDGNVLIFESANPALDAVSGSTNNGLTQYYRYDDRTGDVTCISCAPGGLTREVAPSIAASNQSVPARIRVMSDDGSMVFFPTNEPLVPGDVNQGRDIYEWHNGVVKLITSGVKQYQGGAQASLYTTTASGRDVFFRDNAKLTPEVQDSAFQLYDARIGGGFPPAPAPQPPCVGEQCRGSFPPPPLLAGPTSATLTGGGKGGRAASFTVRRPTAAQRRHLIGTGTLTLAVKVNRPGKLVGFIQTRVGRGVRIVARTSRTVHRAGTVKLRLRLSRAARAQLANRGQLTLVLAVRFSKVPVTSRLVLTLKGRP